MRGKPRVVMIGLDACDAGLAEGFAASGHLPNLGRLFTGGARCRVRNPMGLFVGVLWPTFATGVSADRHGVHCWDEIDVASYQRRTTTPRCEQQLLWQRLSQEDRRVAVLDVPHMQGDTPVNGVQFAEWGCHDRHFGFKSWPLNLAGDIESAFGLHPIFGVDAYTAKSFAPDDYVLRSERLRNIDEDRGLLDGLRRGIAQKRAIAKELLSQGGWDLFLTVFGDSHAIGHQQWHLHDLSHPRFDPDAVRALGGDPILEVYRDLDASVGELLSEVGEDTTVLVLLSHGMGPHYDGTHLLDEILHRIDEFDHGPLGLATTMRRATRSLAEHCATAYAVPSCAGMRGCANSSHAANSCRPSSAASSTSTWHRIISAMAVLGSMSSAANPEALCTPRISTKSALILPPTSWLCSMSIPAVRSSPASINPVVGIAARPKTRCQIYSSIGSAAG